VFVATVGFLAIALSLAYFLLVVPRQTEPARGGTYVEGLVVDSVPELVLNPLLQVNDLSRDVSSLIFSGLTRNEADGTVKDDIALTHDTFDNGQVWEFQLRQDVYWHDGFPVTAKDVVFTTGILKNPDFARFGPSARALQEIWKDIEVDRIGDYTIRFRLTKGTWTPFLNYTSFGLLPEHKLGNLPVADLRRAEFNQTPVGTGPYRLARNGIARDGVTLNASPFYYGQKPYIEKLWFRYYPSARAAVVALETNQVDGVSAVSPEDRERLRASKNITEFSAPYAANTMLFLNLENNERFGLKEVRQALAHAINRKALVEEEFRGTATVSNSPILEFLWAYKSGIKVYEYSPTRARTLLDNAGWKLNQEGIRVKEGQTLVFTLLVGSTDEQTVAERISQDLREVGVVADIRLAASSQELISDLEKRRYDALLLSTKGVINDPDVFQVWSSNGPFNYSFWKNDKADKLLEEARQILFQQERKKRYDEWQDIWIDELPAIPLYYQYYSYAFSSKVKGIQPGQLKVVNEISDRFKDITSRYVLSDTRFGN
jgi:peptide/nickel transport system substrate-binding protein